MFLEPINSERDYKSTEGGTDYGFLLSMLDSCPDLSVLPRGLNQVGPGREVLPNSQKLRMSKLCLASYRISFYLFMG
jgi:hypothetical protein